MDKGNKVCLVVVTFNRREILIETLERIFKQTIQVDQIVIVDNGSMDGTVEYFENQNHPLIKLIKVPNNPGFGAGLGIGMEEGLKLGGFDFFWLMDDDSRPELNTLEKLISSINLGNFDLLGLKGYEMKSGQPKLVTESGVLKKVDYVLVDGALVRNNVLKKAGVVSGKFFMMCEDYEYCKRLKKFGFMIGVLNEKYERLHLGSSKFSHATLWRGYYHARNHFLILKEYPSFMGYLGYFIRQLKYLIAALEAPDRWRRIKLRLTGVIHGIKGVEGKTLDPKTASFIK